MRPNCVICGKRTDWNDDGLYIRQTFGVSLNLEETETLKKLKPRETMCLPCKREAMFANLIGIA